MPQPATTPGAYIRSCRIAAGLSIEGVAAKLSTEPRIAAFARAKWIDLIEKDVAQPSFRTIAVLRSVFPIDLDVLDRQMIGDLLGHEPAQPGCATAAQVDAIHAAAAGHHLGPAT